jgi:ABC-type proline/glycine betaine transport system substrate-binding protein
MELSKHRSDTHTRVAHGTSNSIAYVTGFFDGVIDSLANGIAEILEDGAFFVSRVVHGAKHGWTRGKYTTDQNHKSTSKHLS